MVLPSGTTITFSQIRVELESGNSAFATAETNMADAIFGNYGTIGPVQRCQSPFPDAATPHAMDEWWGYNHQIRATARSGSPFALVPVQYTCEEACDPAVSLSFDTTIYQFSGGGQWLADNGCNNNVENGNYMNTGRTDCSTITNGTRTTLFGCTTTTTSTSTPAPAVCECRIRQGIGLCTAACPRPDQSCTTTAECEAPDN